MSTIAVLGNFVICWCFCFWGLCPPGVIITGSTSTLVENRPAARLGDLCSNCCFSCCPCPNPIIHGSFKTLIDNRPVAYSGSTVVCGTVTIGSIKTFVGF